MSLHNHPWNRWPDVQPLSPAADLARLAPGVGNVRHYPMKTPNWKPFFFESNQFFDTLEIPGDWARLRHAYADLSNAQLLDAREATYGGHRAQSERDARPKGLGACHGHTQRDARRHVLLQAAAAQGRARRRQPKDVRDEEEI